MVIAVRRRNKTCGKSSRYLNIPANAVNGDESTIVVDSLLLADLRGIIPERDLLEFMETYVEPAFWTWMQKRREREQHAPPVEAQGVPGV